MTRDYELPKPNAGGNTVPMNDYLSKVIVGVSIALALLTIGGTLVFGSLIGPKEAEPMIALAWIQPVAQAFQILAAFAIAFLCIGRYRALGGAWVFWTGTAFLANGVLGIFYLLSWPGLIGEEGVIARLSNTATWIFLLVYSCIALLLAAVNARQPERLQPSYFLFGYVIVPALSILIGLLSVLFEGVLPATIVGTDFTLMTIVWQGILVVLAAIAAVSAYKRYSQGEDVMLGYVALLLIMIAFGLLDSMIGGKRYVFLWYASRFIFASAFTALLFGFLQEGYQLFSRERERAEEMAALNERLAKSNAEAGKSAEEARHRAVELNAANKELEAFSYSVSHDLRAPLRHVDSFSRILLQEYDDKLDEQGKKYLHFVREGSQRASQLIEDMLKLSRVTRAEMRRQAINLSEIAETIATELRNEQPERQVDFSNAPGVTANGDPQLVRVVLDNLIGNAWKFTSHPSDGRMAKIEFGVEQQDDQPVYFVRDNGAGFDMAYADKLFMPFQRLHAVEEFPGTGIGLATVQRIIHRHGGQIWAEGEVDRGATFYFTLG